jgi:hypothetical protein
MNKIKIGDRVQLTAKMHTWHAEFTVANYTRPGEPFVLPKEYYEEIACILGSKARRTKLKGTVTEYGATDDAFKNKRNFVKVDFNWKGLKVGFYCSENDLKRL